MSLADSRAASDSRVHDRRIRVVLIVAILLGAAVLGLRTTVLPATTDLDSLLSLGCLLSTALLCRVDSRLLGKPVLRTFLWITLFLGPASTLFFAWYVLWSRGWSGWLVLMLSAGLWSVAAWAGSLMGSVAVLVASIAAGIPGRVSILDF